METNFFSQIENMQLSGDLLITIGRGSEGKLVVAVLLQNEQCTDNAKNVIPPLVLRETPEQLDRQFFDSITAPMQGTSSLLLNMEAFIKGQQQAKQQSAMNREQAEKDKKEKDARQKRYTDAMQKVDELARDGKYREAWVKVPEPNLFPEHTETIQKRRNELASKFAPDLFAAPVEPTKEEEVVVEPDLDYSGTDPDNDWGQDDDNENDY